MDSSTEVQAEEKVESELVEVMVETEAEAGASGYSVTGGGERGIFIKDVLKDSSAAKHLSLQQGDQLLSARVYFDNVKYEDALKILQCAEPYKVSFLLKRTVPGADVSVHSSTPNVEVKGPKAKMQKMCVKSVKPFKAKKKRGGRFGLKRLKEKKKGSNVAELEMEGPPSRVALSPIDVEFAFPKLKLRKDGKTAAESTELRGGAVATGKKKRIMRFPRLKTKGAAVVTGEVDMTQTERHQHISPAAVPEAKVKVKGHKFGIHFPKTKKTRSDTALSGQSLELNLPDVKFTPPSLEFSLPSRHKDVGLQKPEGKGSKCMYREGEFSLGVCSTHHTDEIDGDIRTKGSAEFSIPEKEAKGSMGLSGIKMSETDTIAPNIDLQLDTKSRVPDELEGPSFKGSNLPMQKVDISLPKIGSFDMDIECPEKSGKMYLPPVGILLPKMSPMECNTDVEGPPEKDGTFKMPGFNVLSEGDVNAEGPEVKGKIHMPKVDISLPKGQAEGDIDIEGHAGKGGKFKMPGFDVSLPKFKSSEGDIAVEGPEVKGKIHMPKVDISLPKGQAEGDIDIEGHAGKGGKFKMPGFDVSLPKFKSSEGDVNAEGPEVKGKIHMPKVDISLPKGQAEGDIDIEGHAGKGGKFKMPGFDVSLPKCKSSEGDIDVEGPEVKGKIHMPKVDISPPKLKAEGDVDIEGYLGKGGKFQMPKFDISLPKTKASEMCIEGPGVKSGTIDISLPKGKAEGEFKIPSCDISCPKMFDESDVKGEKLHMPQVGFSLPEGKSETDMGNPGKVGKFQMPSFDVSLPKIKSSGGDMKEGTDVKSSTFHMPSIDFSIPKGKTDDDISADRDASKGETFHMPSLDISPPKVTLPEGIANVKGPNFPGGKVQMAKIDISLPKGKTVEEINIDGHSSKGGRFKLPKFGIFSPKIKSPEGKINIEGPEVKGGKIHMPTINISPPKEKAEGDVNVEEKFQTPDVNIEGPHFKGDKMDIPKIDISLSKGQIEEAKGHKRKWGKFHMPSIDISLPKLKLPEGEVKTEDPEGKGGKSELAAIDISLPKEKIEGGNDLEGPSEKGGRVYMPTFDISLPNMKSPEKDVSLKGPEIQGGKCHIPTIDFSLPKGKVETDTECHSGKFKMPVLDLSLPKMNTPESEVRLEGPEIKCGTMDKSLSKWKTGKIDIEGKKEKFDIEVPSGKGGKFPTPKFEISLPKMKLPEKEIKLEGQDGKGKIHMPTIDISLPKGKTEGDLEVKGHGGKVGKFHMPSVDISLPQMKLSEGEGKVEGPGAKGEMQKKNISLPKGEGEIDIKGPLRKGGKIKMPTFDVSLPKLNQPEYELTVEGPDVKGGKYEKPKIEAEYKISSKLPTVKLPKVDISAPKVDLDFGISKGNYREEMELLKAEGGRPSSGTSFDMPDVSLKMPKFSLPKFVRKSSRDINIDACSPDFDHHISSPQVDGEDRLTSAELGGDGKTKVPTLEIFKKEADISIAGPDMEIKTEKVNVDIPKPGIDIENHEEKVKYRLKFPKFKKSSPKAKLHEGELLASLDSGMEGKAGFHAPDVTIKKFFMPGFGSKESKLDRGGPSGESDAKLKVKIPSVEISLPAAKTSEQEVLLPKAEVDVSEADIRGYEGSLKIPKMPTIDISAPKIDLDVTLPKVKHKTKIDGEGGTFKMPNIQMPDIDLSHPKSKGKSDIHLSEIEGAGRKFKMSDMKMPKVEISLSKGKHGETDVDRGEKCNMPHIDISPIGMIERPEKDIQGGVGKFKTPHMKMPNVDISLPKAKSGEIEGPNIDIEGGGGKCKMPHMKMPNVDLSLPKGKSGEIGVPEMEIKGGKFKMPHMNMPNVNISLPKAKSGEIEGPSIEIESGRGKFEMPHMKMPDVDISLPKGKSGEIERTEMEIEARGGKFKMPYMKMPDVEISLPKGKSHDIYFPETEMEGGKFKMPQMKMPNIDLSLPKGKGEEIEGRDIDIECGGGKFKMPHMKMPNVDLSLPKGRSGEIGLPEMEIEEGKFKMPHMKMPNVDISLPKAKSGEIEGPDIEIETRGGKFKMPEMKMPDVEISLPKGKSQDIYFPETEMEEGKFKMPHMKMPNLDISLPKGQIGGIEEPEVEIQAEGGKIQMPGIKMPKVDISLSKGKSEHVCAPAMEMNGKGGTFKMPNVDTALPKSKSGDMNVLHMEIEGQDGRHNMPEIKLPNQTSSHADKDHQIKIKMPKISMECPKVDLEPDLGLQKDMKNRKRIELPDLDLNTSGTKVKGPKAKGTKFKIGIPKIKNTGDQAVDVATNATGKEMQGTSGQFKIKKSKLGKGADVVAGGSVVPNITLSDVELPVSQGDSQEGELHSPGSSATCPKLKLANVEITGTGHGGAQCQLGEQEEKDGIKLQVPEFALPSVGIESKQDSVETTENRSNLGIKVPKIPDTEFDMGSDDNGTDTSMRQYGVALPAMSSPNARVNVRHPEVEYEGPKMPNVKKAVFVLVNPQTDHADMSTSLAEVKVCVESGGATIERPKITMKPSCENSRSKVKGAAMGTEGDGDKSKGAKLKIPKVTFSPGKNSSLDMTTRSEGSSSSLNGEKDSTFKNGSKEDKAKSGKLKLPRIEFSSPYSKSSSGEDDIKMNSKLVKESSGHDGETKRMKVKSGKISFPGFKKKTSKGVEESQGNVVSSLARTEMLDRDSSESPPPIASMCFVSGTSRGQVESENSKPPTEGGLESTCFKAPKFNLKLHSTGILHITPEGSPRGSLSSLQDLDETSGTYHIQVPSISTQEVSEEHVTTTKEGTVTMVTKTTKRTVSRTGQTHTSLSDFDY